MMDLIRGAALFPCSVYSGDWNRKEENRFLGVGLSSVIVRIFKFIRLLICLVRGLDIDC